jgi:2-oxoglutarate ferredoxin oxidoreductase subunit alpha
MRKLREEGIRAGLIRPITLWPFPSAPIAAAAKHAKAILTVEMSMGQMVEDVRLAVEGAVPVHFFGRTGGIVPTVREIITQVETLAKGGH